MNLPTLLVLLLVAAALFLALRACRRGRGSCSCGYGADGCTGKKSSACSGCPYCRGK
jgi:hypothetical protein